MKTSKATSLKSPVNGVLHHKAGFSIYLKDQDSMLYDYVKANEPVIITEAAKDTKLTHDAVRGTLDKLVQQEKMKVKTMTVKTSTYFRRMRVYYITESLLVES